MLSICVKYHSDEIDRIEQISEGDWIDLRAAETVTLKAEDYALISLGISVKMPEGYEAHLAPRSSAFRNWGIQQPNSVGVIDNSYSGDNDIWKMPVVATRDTTINVNDRICQFRLMPRMEKINIIETDHLDGPDRGGFGSTGIN